MNLLVSRAQRDDFLEEGFLRVADKIRARKAGVSTLADWLGS